MNLRVLSLLSVVLVAAPGFTFRSDNSANRPGVAPVDSLVLVFSTYIGGKTFEQIRDITCDRDGNVYITGGTQSASFPTTPGAYQRAFKTGGTSTGSGGPMDIFVVKYSPSGNLLWSTLLGGPNYDRAYAMEVDDSGYVYLGGRAGEGFPTSPGTLQPIFGGDTSTLGAYGKQDGFLAKLSPDGSRLVWATYFGRQDGGIIRDMDIDAQGNVYLVQPGVRGPHPHVTPGAWRTRFSGSNDVVVAKVSPDAGRVLWASYYGGSGDDGGGPSVRVDPSGTVTIVGSTTSTNLPTTATAYDTSYNGGTNDLFVAKFSADGASLLYATYLGGSGNEGVETHNLAVDAEGNAYISSGTTSTNFPTTPGAFQRTFGGGGGDTFISKISSDGTALLASTYVGGSAGDFPQGVYVDADRNVMVGGNSQSPNFPVTGTAYQKANAGAGDFFVFKLAADFTAPLYSTYLGGALADDGRTLWGDSHGNIYIGGQTLSRNWPVRNAAQTSLADTAGRDDGCLAKFSPASPATGARLLAPITDGMRLRAFPNPASDRLTIGYSLNRPGTVLIMITDILGRTAALEHRSRQAAGEHAVTFTMHPAHAGVHLCTVRAGSQTEAIPVVVAPR